MSSKPIYRKVLMITLCLTSAVILLATGSLVAGQTENGKQYLPILQKQWPFRPAADHLLISEVMPDPSVAGNEWIEIYNPTDEEIFLSDYKIGDEETLGENEGMLQFPPGTVVGPKSVLIVAANANLFHSVYAFYPSFEMKDSGAPTAEMIKYTAWAGGNVTLTNSGDEILLLNLTDTIVDKVSWGNSTWAFDPAADRPGKAEALIRFPSYFDSDTAEDWQVGTMPTPGEVQTPPLEPTATNTPDNLPTPTPFGGDLYISEFVYDPTGTEPHSEWIEIVNPSYVAYDISGFKIGDEETQGEGESMYIFPSNTILAGKRTIVVANRAEAFFSDWGHLPDFELNDTLPEVPKLEKFTDWAGGTMSLGNTGDEILLLDFGNNLIDTVSWGNSNWAFDPAAPDISAGHSLERRPPNQDTDSAADWVDQSLPNPGFVDFSTPTPTPPPFSQPLLISEVLFNPDGTDTGHEWIEIYNPGEFSIDLSSFKIGDEETRGQGEGMLQFPEGTIILPGSTLIISQNAMLFEQDFGFLPDFEATDSGSPVLDMLPYPLWGAGSLSLTNTGDEVLLLDANDYVIDAVSWGSSVWAFDPSVSGGQSPGHSIERFPGTSDSDSAQDWRDQPIPDPGNIPKPTPTATPTVFNEPSPTPTATQPPP